MPVWFAPILAALGAMGGAAGTGAGAAATGAAAGTAAATGAAATGAAAGTAAGTAAGLGGTAAGLGGTAAGTAAGLGGTAAGTAAGTAGTAAGVGAGSTGVWGGMTVPQLVTRGASLASMMGGGGGSQPARPDEPSAYPNFLAPNAQGPLLPAGGVSLRNQMMGSMRAIHDSPRFQHAVGSLSDALSNYGRGAATDGDMMRHQNLATLMRQPPSPYQYNPYQAGYQIGSNMVNGGAALLKYLPLLFK